MRYDEYDGLAKDMDFIQAVKSAKGGMRVTREAWAEPDGAYRYFLSCDKNSAVRVYSQLTGRPLKTISDVCVLADDWMETDE
jgi:hypothetical protein